MLKQKGKLSALLKKDRAGESIKFLRSVCNRFDDAAEKEIEKLLQVLASAGFNNSKLILEYHQLLLFLCAYPRSKNSLLLAEKELCRLATLAKEIYVGKNEGRRRQLENAGIANTQLNVSFSFHLVKWLLEEFHDDVLLFSIDADDVTIEQVLCACLPDVERDLIADKMLSPLHMIQRLKGGQQSDLEFLVQFFSNADIIAEAKDALWDSLKIFISWKLNEEAPSLTNGRSSPRKIFFHRNQLLKKFNWQKEIQKPVDTLYKLSQEEKKRIVTVGRGVLAMFQRETDPVTYAQQEDVEFFDMGRGIDMALYPMISQRRLPLESYIGYIAFKNRIPVAYGGGWIFLHRSKIGINVFPAFRGGESAFLFCQVLRLYHHHYNVKKFIVEPYQVGKNNTEGLKSGAFWFYYRFGFKPSTEKLQGLAAKEFEKILAEKNYRTPLSIMKQLANSNFELNLSPEKKFVDADPLKISEAVTHFINDRFGGNRNEANEWALTKLFSELNIRDFPSWSPGEIRAFNNLSLAACAINDVSHLNDRDRNTLLKLLRLKGGKHERDFILASQRHWKFLT